MTTSTAETQKLSQQVANSIADAIREVIEKRRFEITIPRRSPQLVAARIMRLLAPGALRRGMAWMEPVPDELLERARSRSREGKRLGEPD